MSRFMEALKARYGRSGLGGAFFDFESCIV
jgi:hypothetical protein